MSAARPSRALPISAVAVALGLSACATQPKNSAQAATKPAAAPSAPATVVQAAAPADAPAPAVASGPKKKLWGVVSSFDAATGRLTVKDKRGRTHQLRLAADAKLTKGGNYAAVAATAIRAGDRVTLWHAGDAALDVHVNVVPVQAAEAAPAKTSAVAKH